MRYLRKFNESIGDDPQFQELMDNFSYISDTLGEPKIEKKKWGTLYKYSLQWELGLNLHDLQSPTEVVGKLKMIVENFEDIVAAEERASDFTIKMSIGNNVLNVEANPIETGDDNYRFIIGQAWRDVRINIVDIERYLTKNGIDVKSKHFHDEYETSGGGWSEIVTTDIPTEVRGQLKGMIEAEMRSKMVPRIDYDANSDIYGPVIDREFSTTISQNKITFYPEGEKTFISI